VALAALVGNVLALGPRLLPEAKPPATLAAAAAAAAAGAGASEDAGARSQPPQQGAAAGGGQAALRAAALAAAHVLHAAVSLLPLYPFFTTVPPTCVDRPAVLRWCAMAR
jgi:hypothetical protein